MTSRRRFLAAGVGLAAALSGCAGRQLSDEDESRPDGSERRPDDESPAEQTCTTGTIAEVGGEWPMFGANATHTGRVDADPGSASTATVAWKRERIGPPGPPMPQFCVADGTLFLAGKDGERRGVDAVDIADGTTVWSDATEVNPRGTPATDGERVYVSSGGEAPDGETVAGIHAYAVDGEKQWSTTYDVRLVGSPTVVGDTVFATAFHRLSDTGDGDVFALDAATGETVWTEDVGEREMTPPAIADGVLFTAGTSVYAFDAGTGERLWTIENMELNRQHPGGWETLGSPSIVGERVLVPGSADSRSHLAVVDRESGAVERVVDLPGLDHVDGYAAVTDDRVVVANEDRTVALDREDWSVAWTATVETSPPNLVGDAVCAVDGEAVRLLDATTGEERAKLRFDTSQSCNPLLGGGKLLALGDALIVQNRGTTYGVGLS